MFNVYAVNKRTKESHVFATAETERQAEKICEEWGWSMSDYEGSYWLEYEEVTEREV